MFIESVIILFQDMFTMDPNTAIITLETNIDETAPSVITFKISAVDDNAIPRTGHVVFHCIIHSHLMAK